MFRSRNLFALALALVLPWAAADAAQRYGLGRAPTPAEIAGWDIDVRGTDGKGLPPGRGSVERGEQIYSAQCASCHGDFGEGNGRMPVLAGGKGSLRNDRPVQTVGSYWPYAPTLYDYIRRAMPFSKPQSLSNDDAYAVTAYVLYLNDLVPKGATLDAKSLAAVRMPNRNGFITRDPRPDVHNVACMHGCRRGPVKVTSDLAKSLGVTPAQAAADARATASPGAAVANVPPPAFADVQRIVAQRCAACHAQHPTQPGFASAAGGMMLDTPERIKAAAARINAVAVKSRRMPLGNVTHMTDDERATLGRWIAGGAKT